MKKIIIAFLSLVLAVHSYGQSPAKVAVTKKINDSIRSNGSRQITAITLNAVMNAVNNVNMDSGQVLNTINAQKGILSGIAGLVNGKVSYGYLPLFVDSIYRRAGVDSIYFRIANTGVSYAILDSAGAGGPVGGTSITNDVTATLSGSALPATVVGIRGASVPALTNGFLKQFGGTWIFDNSTYITGNQLISFSAGGDASSTGAASATNLTPSFIINGLKGVALPSLVSGYLRYNGSSWVFDTNTYLLASSLSNVINSLQVVNRGGTPGILSNVFSSRPAAGTAGNVFISTDTKEIWRDNGSTWDLIGSGSGAGTVHVTAPIQGDGSTGSPLGLTNWGVPAPLRVYGYDASSVLGFLTLGTAAFADKPVSGNASSTQVALGNDSRLTDSRTPAGTNVVPNTMLAQMPANTLKGNNTGSPANAADLTTAQVTAILNLFTTSNKGLVPAPVAVNGYFLSDDGTWHAGGGGGSVKSAKSVTGTGVTADSLRLVNDIATPGRGMAYMTRPAGDSAKGFYEIEEHAFGYFYKAGTWADATTGFVNKGSFSVTATAGKLVVTGGATDYSKALLIDGPIQIDKWEAGTIGHVDSKNATVTDAFAVGKYSLNGYSGTSASNLTAKFLMNSGVNSGQISINGYLGAQLGISTAALSFSIGDSILLKIERDGYNVTAVARNLTTNSAPIFVYYTFSTYLPDNPGIMDNTGDFAVFGLGGNFTIDSLFSYSKYPINARLWIAGDSKIAGYDVTNQSDRISDQVNNSIRTTINGGGGTDRLRELAMCLPTIIRFHPQQLWNLMGSNSVRHGDDSATVCTLYDSINTALRADGIDVITGVLYETSVDMSKLWNHILQIEPSSKRVNVYDALKVPGCLAPDNVHLLSFGDSVAATTGIKSGLFYATNQRYGEPANTFIRNQYRSPQNADYNIFGNATANSYKSGNVFIGKGLSNEGVGYAVLGTTTGGTGLIQLADSAGATDAKRVDMSVQSNHFLMRWLNDAANSAVNVLDFTRSGTTTTNLKLNGNVIVNQASGVPITLTPVANGDGLVENFTVTGFVRPLVLSGSATAGLQQYMSNTSTNSGAYTNIFLSTASSAAGSPTFAVQNAGTGRQYYWGLNRNTDNWQLETGQNFFSEWGATHLLIIKPSGQVNIGGTIGNDMLTVTGSEKVTDTLKLPNIVRKLLDTTSFKPVVVDASGNSWKTDWANFSSSSAPFSDATALVKNSSDPTKLAIFSAASITTATTRTYGLPDFNGIFAMTNHAQSWTGVQDFTGATTNFTVVTAVQVSSGQMVSTGTAPNVTIGSAAPSGGGTTATASSGSNGMAGEVVITTGTGSGTGVTVVTIQSTSGSNPGSYRIFLQDTYTAAHVHVRVNRITSTTWSMELQGSDILAASTTYSWNYFISN